MLKTFSILSTSSTTADVQDIILRETSTRRLVFRPTIVNNEWNQDASVRGTFIYQRKSQNDKWEDHNELALSNLRVSEWIKLEIKSEEMLKLFNHVQCLYELYNEHGIPYGNNEVTLTTPKNTDIIRAVLADDNIGHFVESEKAEVIIECLKWLGDTDNLEDAITSLKKLDFNNLNELNAAVGIVNIEKMLKIWDENRDNKDEEFWQNKFFENPWILSQLFASSIVMYEGKGYLGGKQLDNTGGNVGDFIYRNQITNNLVIIEIKTPKTKLVSSLYRNNAYNIHQNLIGGISQMLNYKNEIQRRYYEATHNEPVEIINPRCVLIAGDLQDIASDDTKLCSFELFRRSLTDVEILTYDEVFNRLQLLLDLLKGNSAHFDA